MDEHFKPDNGVALLNRKALRAIVPASDVSVWRWIKRGDFPQPLSISNRNYWRSDEIDQWLAEHSARREGNHVPGQ